MASIEHEIKQTKHLDDHLKANLNIMFTANWLHNKISANLKPFNITPEQFNVLRILKGSHPKQMCQKDILSRMVAASSNLTLIIKKLSTKGLISVQSSAEDKRQYQISITKVGLDLLSKIEKDFVAKKVSYNNLSVSEAFHLNALLNKLRG